MTLVADAPTRARRRGGDGAGRRARTSPSPAGCCRGACAAHLLAVYGFARLVDELGDCASPGDRLAALDWLERDLDRAYRGPRASIRCWRRLQPTLRECALPREPFARLIEANRIDQRVEPL